MPKPKRRKKKNSNRKFIIVIILLLLIFVLLMGGVLYYFLVIQPGQKGIVGGKRESEALQGSIERMTDEEIQEALNNIVDEGMFRISIASDIVAIEDGQAEVRIENNLTNRYLMQVSIYLDETGEEIYSTDLIDPGYYIQYTKFDKHLDPGEYEATAIFTAMYPDTGEIVGTVGAEVMIYVFPDATPTPSPSPSVTPEVTATPAAEVQG